MIEYKCGHKTYGAIILDNNPLSVSAYLEWSKTVGFEGTREECLACWLNKSKDEKGEE